MANSSLARKLEASGLAALVGGLHNELFFDAIWPSDEVEEFLRAASNYGFFDLNPWMTFTRSEIGNARFLRIRPRIVIEESDADYEIMRREMDGLPWIGDEPDRRCRLPQRISLSRVALKPNQVAVVGQWSAEYVVHDAVRRIFEDDAATGIEFRPVLDSRSGVPIEEFSHLYTDHLLPPRIIDISTRRIVSPHPEEQGYDIMGCFCYGAESLEYAFDFNRTGEGNVAFEFPDWIVSAKVYSLFVTNKLKGWAFEPVLELNTDLHDDYLRLWSSLFDLIAECRGHTVRGHS